MGQLQEQIDALVKAAPEDQVFAVWRAVFALAHVDGAVAPEEVGFVTRALDVFKFSENQRAIIYQDMTDRGDVLALFKMIEGEALRGLFFRLARILIWCDGLLHEYELSMIETIKDFLGQEAAAFEADLRWLRRRPDLPLGVGAADEAESVVKQLMVQIIDFYKGEQEDAA